MHITLEKKKRGRGRAENCDGLLKVEGTGINRNSVWEGNIAYIPISNQADLKLFEIVENCYTGVKELVFHSNPTNSQERMFENRIAYSDGYLINGSLLKSVRVMEMYHLNLSSAQ